MIETTIPENNVAEVMEGLRVETSFPLLAHLPATPPVGIPGPIKLKEPSRDSMPEAVR